MPRHRPAEETARLGDGLYERAIRPHVELSRHGQIVAIDVTCTGNNDSLQNAEPCREPMNTGDSGGCSPKAVTVPLKGRGAVANAICSKVLHFA